MFVWCKILSKNKESVMSTGAPSAGKQHPNTAVSHYYCGPWGTFASPKRSLLANDAFNIVLSFLGPKDLARAESVRHSWKQFINKTDQWKKQYKNKPDQFWKKQYKIQLNSGAIDPGTYLPASHFCKEGLRLVYSRVYDENSYRYHLGAQVERFPKIPEALSLRRSNDPDPCDPTQTIGQKYVWMYSPSYFWITVDRDSFKLDKPDDLNDEKAPRLIRKQVGLLERCIRWIGFGSEPEKVILKVPNTIHNLGELFKYLKNGPPSTFYDHVWEIISVQHGDKRIPSGWFCMREDVIERNQTFAQQQEAAAEMGVVISQLGHRILFNFLRHAKTNTYPDGRNPRTFARTSTPTYLEETPCSSRCGDAGPSGLIVDVDVDFDDNIAHVDVGVAVALAL